MPVPAGRAAWVQARVQAVPWTERPRCPSSGLGGGAGGAATGVPSPQCCQTLLSHRVDPALRDEDGYTAADLAEYHGHRDCAQYLRDSTRPVSFAVPPPHPHPGPGDRPLPR